MDRVFGVTVTLYLGIRPIAETPEYARKEHARRRTRAYSSTSQGEIHLEIGRLNITQALDDELGPPSAGRICTDVLCESGTSGGRPVLVDSRASR